MCLNVYSAIVGYNILYILELDDIVIHLFYSHTDFLSSYSIYYWKWNIEILKYYCLVDYFFFKFCEFLLCMFWSSVVRCICTLYCYTFLKCWPCCHYELSLFVSIILIFLYLFYLFVIATPAFYGYSFYGISFLCFYLNIVVFRM